MTCKPVAVKDQSILAVHLLFEAKLKELLISKHQTPAVVGNIVMMINLSAYRWLNFVIVAE